MRSIVNVSESWGIGKNGDLLVRIPDDLKHFKNHTRDKAVVIGLNTLKSFPGMRPLPGRINIVLTEELNMIPMESIKACDCYIDDVSTGADLKLLGTPGATVMIACTSPEEVLDIVSLFNGDDVYVSGGASIYRLFLPWCDTALVTVNDCKTEADTFYPNLDEDPAWERVEESALFEHDGTHYRFTTYKRKDS